MTPTPTPTPIPWATLTPFPTGVAGSQGLTIEYDLTELTANVEQGVQLYNIAPQGIRDVVAGMILVVLIFAMLLALKRLLESMDDSN